MSRRIFGAAVIVLMILAVYPPAAAITPTPTPLTTSVDFVNTRIDPGGLQWMEDQAAHDGVDLNIAGIYALDKDRVFLFGGLGTSSGTFRSVLLRSGDGGSHWAEVMPPVTGSDIQQIVFVGQDQGWALALWTVEGPGPVVLYHTVDAGWTWTKLGDVPKKTALGYPGWMAFSDERHGQIEMHEEEQMYPLTTSDGGQTWQETVSPDATQTAVATDAAQTPAPALTESTCQDGSSWKVETGSGDSPALIVRRRLAGEGDWSFAVALPPHFDYVNGQVVSR